VDNGEVVAPVTKKKAPKPVVKKKKPVAEKKAPKKLKDGKVKFTGESDMKGKKVYNYIITEGPAKGSNLITFDQKASTIAKKVKAMEAGYATPIKKKAPSKAGRPAMTIAEKTSKLFSIGTKTDDGFPVLDKKGEVVQTFPKKKDAVLWVEGKGTTKTLEAAYKERKAQPTIIRETIKLPIKKDGKPVKVSRTSINKAISGSSYTIEKTAAQKGVQVKPAKETISMTITDREQAETNIELFAEEVDDLRTFGRALKLTKHAGSKLKDVAGKFTKDKLYRQYATEGKSIKDVRRAIELELAEKVKILDAMKAGLPGFESLGVDPVTSKAAYSVKYKGKELGRVRTDSEIWDLITENEKARLTTVKVAPTPKTMPKVEAESIQEIPSTTKLPFVGSGHGRTYGKVWYPIDGDTDQTSSPFQMAVHKVGTKWAITWNGSKSISDVITKKYGLPLNEVGFANQKEAQKRASEILRSLVKVYKGENLTNEKVRIRAKDLIIKKFGKQNLMIRMRASKMEYFPFTSMEKTAPVKQVVASRIDKKSPLYVQETGRKEVTRKLSGLPEYRIYTMFSEKLNQFVYYIQRKQDGTSDRSFPMTFTQGQPNGKVPGKSTVVNDIQGVKTWLLDKIEQNGYYNALPSADDTDLKVRFNAIEFEDGTAPLKPRVAPETKVEKKEPTKAEVKKTEASQEKFDKSIEEIEAQLKEAEKISEEDKTRIDAIDGEVKELRNEKEMLLEAIEEGYNLTDMYQEIEDENVISPTRESIESVEDEIENLKVESAVIKAKYSTKRAQLRVVLASAKRAFKAGDVQSAEAQIKQSEVEIEVVKPFTADIAAGDVSLDAQNKHKEALKAAKAEQIETELAGKLGYSQIHPQWTGAAAKLKSGKVIYTSADNKNAIVQYWNGDSGELTFAYIKKSAKGQGFTYVRVEKAPKELHQAVKDFKKHYIEIMGNVSPFTPGETVTVSEGLSKKSAKFESYVKAMMKLLKLDNIQVFVSYDNEVKGKGGDKYGLYGKYFQYREQAANRKKAFGTLSKPEDVKSRYIIQLKSGLNTTQTVRTFLHELGHIIFYEHFARTDSKTKSSIISDWNAWKNNMRIGKVTYNTLNDAMRAIENSKQHDKVVARIEATLFTEWFANRVREQVIANEKTGGNLATQFFKKVATNLMDWAKQVMGISNKRDAVTSFLESIVDSKSLTQIGINYMKENGWTKRSIQDAVLEDPKPATPEVDVKKTISSYVKSYQEHKPGLRRNPLSMININPTSSEADFDLEMDRILIDEENLNRDDREKMPLDKAVIIPFAQPHWIKKQFESMGQFGFAKIYDAAINSKRLFNKTLAKALKTNKELFALTNKQDLYALNSVIHELDQNAYKTKDLAFKFNMEMDAELGYEVVAGLNEQHYKELKQFVMTQMKGSNLSTELADMYVNLRKSLDESLMRVTNMVKVAVKKGDIGDDNILREMLTRQSLGQLDNYFPHKRFGDTFITGTDSDGNTVVRYHYDSNLLSKVKGYSKLSGRQVAQKAGLLEDPENVKLKWSRPELVEDANLQNTFDTPIPIDAMNALVDSAISKMELDKDTDAKTREGLNQAFRQAVGSQMNVAGWQKSFTKRRNVAGYSKDFNEMKRVLQDYLVTVHGSINRMGVMKEFSQNLSKIDPRQNPEEWKYASNYISTYFETLPEWVTSWKKFAFVWYLGGRASTAVLNSTQNFLTGVQRLNIDSNLTNPVMAKWLMDSSRNLADMFGRKGIPLFIKGARLKGHFKVLSDAEHALVTKIYDDGDANDQLLQDVQGQAISGPLTSLSNNVVRKLGGFMSFVERQNRVSIALTPYRLATKGQVTHTKTAAKYGYGAGQKFSVEDATQYAEDVIAETHWHYGKENLPQFFRNNPKMQSMYVFKSFPMNLMFMLREWSLHEGGKGAVGVLGMLMWAGMFGGLKGLPFEEEVDYIIKKTYGVNWKDELRIKLTKEGNLHSDYIDVLYNGVPTAIGIDLSGSIGVGFSGTQKIDPHKNDFQTMLSFAEGTLGVPVSFAKDMFEARSYLITQKNYRKGAEKLSPKFFAAFLKAQRLKTIGLMSRKGFKVNYPYNMTPYKYNSVDSAIRTLGFTPSTESKMYEKMEVLRFKEGREKKIVDGLAVRVSNGSLTIEEAFKKLSEKNKGKRTEDFINPKLLKEGIKSRLGASKPDKLKMFRLIQIAKRYK